MGKINNVPYLDIKRAHEDILPELKTALVDVIDSNNVVLGPQLKKFEYEYAKFCGTKYCGGVANGFDAIVLSLMTLGIGANDEVIVPSNTYIATLLSASRVGAKPVLVEPNQDSYNIDYSKIEEAITKKTKAIIPVHLFGQACEMDKIMSIARKHSLYVVEDNAQSQGASFKGKSTGSFGIMNATSFYPGKNLGALGDAGAITTNNKKLFEKLIIIRNYGAKEKYFSEVKGYNSRLDEIQAAFLSIKLKNLNSKNKIRNKNAKRYLKELENVGDLILPKTTKNASHVYHVFAIRTKKRNALQAYLAENNIGTVIHYPIPPHLQKAYEELNFKEGSFPIAEELAKTSLSIPIFPEMTEVEQDYIIKTIKKFYAN